MPSRSNVAALALLLALLLWACSGGSERLGATPIAFQAYDATGLASWYGEELAGARTASGERFDPGALTVAHRTLPLGSLVEITALGTGRSIVARVNDRGPGRRDRLIDLSRGAAHLLGTDRSPLATVRVRALPPGRGIRPSLISTGIARPAAPVAPGRYWLQVASFTNPDRAQALADRLGGAVIPTGALYRVRLGPLPTAAAAQAARDAVAARGYADAQLIPTP